MVDVNKTSYAFDAGVLAGKMWCATNNNPISKFIVAQTDEVVAGFNAGCDAYNAKAKVQQVEDTKQVPNIEDAVTV